MRKFYGVVAIVAGWALLGEGLTPSAEAWPLTDDQRARLEQYIPRTFARLEAQQPVHIVSLGDSVTMMYQPDANSANSLLSYQSRFAEWLAQEFFYPGAVRVLNPANKHPAKFADHIGEEILLENLADGGTSAIDVLQPLTAQAFLNDPDLVIVNYGINDASRGLSLEVYRQSLQKVADACKAQKVDLIIMGCSIVQISPGPSVWGITRAYTTVAKEVAEANDLLFVDLGRIIARSGAGVPAQLEADAAIEQLSNQLGEIFSYKPPPKPLDKLHPNPETHQMMGREMFRQLMEGPPPSHYSISALGQFVSEDTLEVSLSLKNESKEIRRGHIGALGMRRFVYPEAPNFSFELRPGESRQVKLTYKRFERDAFGNTEGGNTRYFPADVADPYLRLSYFVVDEDGADLLDAVTRIQPVGAMWTQQRFNEITDSIRIEWRFVNGLNEPIEAKYRIGLGNAVSDPVDFQLPPLGANIFEARFPFKPPAGAVRLKYPLHLEIEANGVKYSFHRELEAHRDIGLGERIALSQYDRYHRGRKTGNQELDAGEEGVVMRVDADAAALYFTFDFQGVDFLSLPNVDSMLADLHIDARPADRIRDFGFAHKLRVKSGAQDNTATVERPQLAVFGEGYNMILSEQGFRSALTTQGDGKTRRLQVTVPRQYLFLHEWKIGDPKSVLGLNPIISMAAIHPETGKPEYPGNERYVLTFPSRGVGINLYQFDPRGWATLRLANGPFKTWSAWIY